MPNIALMRLARWHRFRGDEVHCENSLTKTLFEPKRYDRVYASAIFSFSARRLETFRANFPTAICGGTGTESAHTLESVVGNIPHDLDYSDHDVDYSIGFLQRGCRLKCGFCVVPTKEGAPRSNQSVGELWRGPPHPRKLHILDNDFFGVPEWRRNIRDIVEGKFRVCLSQGINVRMIDQESSEALASIEYRDTKFQARRLYTAWDNLGHERIFFQGVDRLEAAGIPAKHVMAYMLIGYDPTETWKRIHYRFDKMVARGIRPYPMVYDQGRRDLKRFQRWAVTGLYRVFPFSEYGLSKKGHHEARTKAEITRREGATGQPRQAGIACTPWPRLRLGTFPRCRST